MLDRMYKKVEEECGRLRVQYHAQEDDRQLLIRQILYLKKQNRQLKDANGVMEEELADGEPQRNACPACCFWFFVQRLLPAPLVLQHLSGLPLGHTVTGTDTILEKLKIS